MKWHHDQRVPAEWYREVRKIRGMCHAAQTRPTRTRTLLIGRLSWCWHTRPVPNPSDVVAAPEVSLHGRRLPSAPDEDDVAEDDRNRTDLLTEVRAVLHVEVQVAHQRVSRVPDGGDLVGG